jgi:lysophospholipase L1-like esterase
LLNQYNPFPASALSGTWVGAFNQQTAEVADRWEATLIDLHEWFAGQEPWWIDGYKTGSLDDISLVGPKPIHPNDHGHQAIANALLAAVLGN